MGCAPLPGLATSTTTAARGNFHGTGILGCVEYFEKKYGPSAAHAVIAKLSPASRAFVTPNAPMMGILGARKYPYAMVGDLFRTMMVVARVKDEDAFIRDLTAAGMDATLNTVARFALRYMVSPQTIAENAQKLWNIFHDAGVLRVTPVSETEYTAEISAWPNHDVTVCKIAVEARRRIIERTGRKNVSVSREKCQAWGHDICVYRVRWA